VGWCQNKLYAELSATDLAEFIGKIQAFHHAKYDDTPMCAILFCTGNTVPALRWVTSLRQIPSLRAQTTSASARTVASRCCSRSVQRCWSRSSGAVLGGPTGRRRINELQDANALPIQLGQLYARVPASGTQIARKAACRPATRCCPLAFCAPYSALSCADAVRFPAWAIPSG